jgi:hypothetical protein
MFPLSISYLNKGEISEKRAHVPLAWRKELVKIFFLLALWWGLLQSESESEILENMNNELIPCTRI